MSKILKNKRFVFMGVLVLIVSFSLALNFTFSAFTTSSTTKAADMSVKELNYRVLINNVENSILSAPGDAVTIQEIQIESDNDLDTIYGVYYEVCTSSACSTTTTKPNGFDVYISSLSTDEVSDEIAAASRKTVRIAIDNTTQTDYYIRLKVAGGYAHNTLNYNNNINQIYYEYDLIVETYINGTESDTFPNTNAYTATVTCTSASNPNIPTTGTVTWEASKWVLSVSDITTIGTICAVRFTST